MSQDQLLALEIHNQARAELSIAPLTWDQNLSNDAQQYAHHLAFNDNGLQHSQRNDQGENLACCTGSWPNPFTESSKGWFAEKKDWYGGVVRVNEPRMVGHYTQMIWSTTTHVGMGFAVAGSGTTYVVARYAPQGNVVGELPQQAAGGQAGGPSAGGGLFGQQQHGTAPVNNGTNWPPMGRPGQQQQTQDSTGVEWPQAGGFGHSGQSSPMGFEAPPPGMDMPWPPMGVVHASYIPRRYPGNNVWRPSRPAPYLGWQWDNHVLQGNSSMRKEHGCCTIL